MKIAAMVVLAALSGWFVRGIRFDDAVEPLPQPRAVIVQTEPIEDPPTVNRRAAVEVASLGNRNLFAYRTHEPTVITHRVITHQAPIFIAPPAEIVPAAVPEPPPFPYRYIGKFGPPHNPVAAFSRDHDVLTVRTGERVGDFVVRTIGLESVEVESAYGVRRIPLDAGQ